MSGDPRREAAARVLYAAFWHNAWTWEQANIDTRGLFERHASRVLAEADKVDPLRQPDARKRLSAAGLASSIADYMATRTTPWPDEAQMRAAVHESLLLLFTEARADLLAALSDSGRVGEPESP